MADNETNTSRANDWDDVADKKASGEKAPGAMLAARENTNGEQNSADDVPGRRGGDKGTLEKVIDPVAGKAQKIASDEPGESGTSEKIKGVLKGGHPET